jgi:membrane associated rhomboid family serine protease
MPAFTVLGFLTLIALAQMLSQAGAGWIFLRPAFEAGAWWQLFSSQWVHFTWTHAALNGVVMVLMLYAFQGWVRPSTQCLALLGGYGGVATVLALDSGCAYYAGASGALHGFFAGNALDVCLNARNRHGEAGPYRMVGAALLLVLLIKLVTQHGSAGGIYFPAHEAGAAGGAIAVAARFIWVRSRSFF